MLDWLLGRAAAPVNAITVPASIAGPTISAPSSIPWVSGTTALGLSAVWRCVNLIADSISDMPWREWRGPEWGPEELEPSRLVIRPMATMSVREWTKRVVATECLYNTVYLLHAGGSDSEGVPWSLIPLQPNAVMPLTPEDPWGLTSPTEYFVGGERIPAEFLTIIRRSPFPGISDMSAGILNVARSQFQAYLAADTHLARYWINGGPTVTVLQTTASLTSDQASGISDSWVNRRQLGGPAVLDNGLEAKPFGADPTTDSAVEARREIVADIGRYFGVPSRILNAPAGDSETYANVENDATDLWRYTLRGYAGPIEDAISELLPGDYIKGRRMRLDPTRYLQGDLQSRSQAYQMLVGSGILTIDEARALGFGLGPGGNPAASAPAPAPEAIPAAMVTVSGG